MTYNCKLASGELLFGGYSETIVVTEDFVVSKGSRMQLSVWCQCGQLIVVRWMQLRIPDSVPMEVAAPLLCAGITTYSPLVYYGAKATGSDCRVGVQVWLDI